MEDSRFVRKSTKKATAIVENIYNMFIREDDKEGYVLLSEILLRIAPDKKLGQVKG